MWGGVLNGSTSTLNVVQIPEATLGPVQQTVELSVNGKGSFMVDCYPRGSANLSLLNIDYHWNTSHNGKCNYNSTSLLL